MNFKLTLSRKAIVVRKHLPSHLVVSRIHANRKAYDRSASKRSAVAGW